MTLLGRGAMVQTNRLVKNPGKLLCHVAQSLRIVGLTFQVVLANCLAWPIFYLTQGPSWWHVHLSTKKDSSARASGRWAGLVSLSFLGPS